MVATTTLAQGINTPAEAVIVAELDHPAGGGRSTPYSVAEYKNIIGRAGRLGYAERGQSFLLMEGSLDEHREWEHYVAGRPEVLRSTLLGPGSTSSPSSCVCSAAPPPRPLDEHPGVTAEEVTAFLALSFAAHQAANDGRQGPGPHSISCSPRSRFGARPAPSARWRVYCGWTVSPGTRSMPPSPSTCRVVTRPATSRPSRPATRDVIDVVLQVAQLVRADVDLHELGETLPIQLELGVPRSLTRVARRLGQGLMRPQYLRLHRAGLSSVETLTEASDDVLLDCLDHDRRKLNLVRRAAQEAEQQPDIDIAALLAPPA